MKTVLVILVSLYASNVLGAEAPTPNNCFRHHSGPVQGTCSASDRAALQAEVDWDEVVAKTPPPAPTCQAPDGPDIGDQCTTDVGRAYQVVHAQRAKCLDVAGVWMDNQSTLERVSCYVGKDSNGFIFADYGIGWGPFLNVVTFERITSSAMWDKWLDNARLNTCALRGGYWFQGTCKH